MRIRVDDQGGGRGAWTEVQEGEGTKCCEGQCSRFRGVCVHARTCACGRVCVSTRAGESLDTHMAEITYLFQGLNTFPSCSHKINLGDQVPGSHMVIQ